MKTLNRIVLTLTLSAALPLGAQTVSSLPEPVPTSGPSGWSEDPIRYDGAGNIVTIGNQPFLYDTTGRLLSATITRPDQPGAQTQSYAYDFYGNMTSRTTNGVQTALTTDSATNHLYGPTYDEAGNLTQWQPPGAAHTYTYTYDAFNMITDETTTAVAGSHVIHVYTADDERLWTYDLGANVSHWTIRDLGGKVLRDYQVTGSTWQIARDYFYRDGSLLAAITPIRTEHYSLDHLGTPRVITDGSGFRIGFHHYYPFGEEWTDASGAQEGNPLKFTGHERDADLASSVYGLDYMHARYYSATLGRFLSFDPLFGRRSGPMTLNRFSYVSNRPLTFRDPLGLMKCKDDRCTEEITVNGQYVDYDPEDDRASTMWIRHHDLPDNIRIDRHAQLEDAANRGDEFAMVLLGRDVPGAEEDVNTEMMIMGPVVGFIRGLGVEEINVLTKGLGHAVQRHTVVGAENAGKSIFRPTENIVSLIKAAAKVAPRQEGRRLVFIIDAGRVIGHDVVRNVPTTVYTVVTDTLRNLVTAYPGLPY